MNMAEEIEIQFARVSQMKHGEGDTVYKLVPNPDSGAHDFTDGAQLYWEERPEWKPGGQFFIPREDLRAIGEMMIKAADIADGKW